MLLHRDFAAIRRHMGQSRTIGAVKSFFSKNRRRLDLDRIAEEANAKVAASDMTDAALQVGRTPAHHVLVFIHLVPSVVGSACCCCHSTGSTTSVNVESSLIGG